jgi:hypothetical protein
MLDEERIMMAIYDASVGKRNREDVEDVLNKSDAIVQQIKKIIIEGGESPDKPIEGYNIEHKIHIIHDGSTGKERRIIKPLFYPEQIIQHIFTDAFANDIYRRQYHLSLGSMPLRGGKMGKEHIEAWIQNDEENTKYVLKCDIHHFFESIDLNVLYKKANRRWGKDKRFMNWTYRIIYGTPNYPGLPLGFYSSQWFANFYMEDLDYFIKQQLGVKYYVRYMDDMVMFSSSKEHLRHVLNELIKYIQEQLHLTLKDNWQIFRFNYYDRESKTWKGRELDFLGYRFFRHKTILRKNIMLGATRAARRIGKQGPNYYNASSMLSYMGWIEATNSYGLYLKYIKPYVNIKQIKHVVSKRSKGESERAKHYLEYCKRELARETLAKGYNT